MNQDRNENRDLRGGERLYRVIGEIDDRFVAEAITYRAKTKRSRPALRVLTAIAACLAIVLLIRLAPEILLRGDVKGPTPDVNAAVWAPTEGYDANASLLSTLASLSTDENRTVRATAPKDDGKVRIVWEERKTGNRYEIVLDRAAQYEIDRLATLIEQSRPAASLGADADPAPFSVWISTGSGTAVSPYLAYTDGNVFYGSYADYAPEYLPAESFAAYLEELLSAESPAPTE